MDQTLRLAPMAKAAGVAAFLGIFIGAAIPTAAEPASEGWPRPAERAAENAVLPPELEVDSPAKKPEIAQEPAPQNNAAADLDTAIAAAAEANGVDPSLMKKIVECESSGNPNAVGDGGQSYGLVQINLPSHPSVTEAQATDPAFALEFLAKRLKEGYGHLWTCYDKK